MTAGFSFLNPFHRRLSNFYLQFETVAVRDRVLYLICFSLLCMEVFRLHVMPYIHSIHHFFDMKLRYSLCSTLLRMIFLYSSHQNLYFFPFSFRRTWFLFDDDDNDIASTKNIPLMDIFLVVVLFFQSMDNIWCQRQENTIDWLLSIEHILCFSSLVVVWKQCFASMSAIYPIYVVCRSEMAKPCNRIRFLLLLLLLFFWFVFF